MSVLLFLHGMESRYGAHTPASIEASIRAYAEALGKTFEAIPISGDDRWEQRAAARARIEKGGVTDLLGFSAGGYNAAILQSEYHGIDFKAIGAPGEKINIDFPGVEHMDLPAALAASVVPKVS